MADEKISAMPAAVGMSNTDFFPIVQVGANVKALKSDIFNGRPGEDISGIVVAGHKYLFQESTATDLQIGPGGIGLFDCQNTVTIRAFGAISQPFVQCDKVNGIQCQIGPGNAGIFLLLVGGGSVTLAGPGNTFTIGGFTGVNYQYIAGGAGNWAGSPASVGAALDRIAAAIVARTFGGPIP